MRLFRAVSTALAALALGACEAPDAEEPALLEVFHEDLSESSGLATSSARPGVWFTHNDSGGDPELFAFTLDGGLLEVHPVQGARARDWEDIAAGSCPDGESPCLYIADIGDNARKRDSVQVYAVTVPGPGETAPVVASWDLEYPDEARNAETLLIDPRGGGRYLVTKARSGKSRVYRLPDDPGRGTLTRVASLRFRGGSSSERLTTGGDWHPGGGRVVVRTYTEAWEWQVAASDREAHWKRDPRRIELPLEKQGEAIAYDGEGRLLSTSEGQPMRVSRTSLSPGSRDATRDAP